MSTAPDPATLLSEAEQAMVKNATACATNAADYLNKAKAALETYDEPDPGQLAAISQAYSFAGILFQLNAITSAVARLATEEFR